MGVGAGAGVGVDGLELVGGTATLGGAEINLPCESTIAPLGVKNCPGGSAGAVGVGAGAGTGAGTTTGTGTGTGTGATTGTGAGFGFGAGVGAGFGFGATAALFCAFSSASSAFRLSISPLTATTSAAICAGGIC